MFWKLNIALNVILTVCLVLCIYIVAENVCFSGNQFGDELASNYYEIAEFITRTDIIIRMMQKKMRKHPEMFYTTIYSHPCCLL